MQEIIFIVSYFCIPIIAIWVLRRLKIAWNSINVITVFLWYYFAMSYTGNIILYYFLDDYRYSSGVTNKEIIFQMHVYCASAVFFFLMGAYIAKNIFLVHRSTIVYSDSYSDSNVVLFAHFIVIVCIGIISLFVNQLPSLPILALFAAEDSQSVALLRSMSSNDFSGNYSRYYLFFAEILPFICMFYFGLALHKKTTKHYVNFIIVLMISLIGVSISLERGPAGNLIFGLILVYFMTQKFTVVPIWSLLIVFSALLTVLSLVFFLFSLSSDDVEITIIIMNVFSRLFTGALNAGYYYVEYFPAHFSYLYGATFPNPMGLLPFTPFPITVELMSYVHPEFAEKGIVGSMPAPFWAELYANFSTFGVVAGSLLMGIYYYIVFAILSSVKLTPTTIALIVWTILHFKNSAISGATFLIFDTYLIAVYCIAYVMFKLEKSTQ